MKPISNLNLGFSFGVQSYKAINRKINLQRQKVTFAHAYNGVLFQCYCFAYFYVRPSDFCSLFKVRHVIGCINNDIVVGLWSELLMRLSYYIHQSCIWEKFSNLAGCEPSIMSHLPQSLDQGSPMVILLFYLQGQQNTLS